jgi:hypothetical protein
LTEEFFPVALKPVDGNADLDLHHALGLGAFFTLDDFELNFLAFFQGLEPFTLDVAVMHENIGTVSLGNESIALGIAEPLNLAFYSHRVLHRFPGKKKGKPTGKAFPLPEKPTGPEIAWCVLFNCIKYFPFVK